MQSFGKAKLRKTQEKHNVHRCSAKYLFWTFCKSLKKTPVVEFEFALEKLQAEDIAALLAANTSQVLSW